MIITPDFHRLLNNIEFCKQFGPDQARQNVGPDRVPCCFETLMLFEKSNVKNYLQTTKMMICVDLLEPSQNVYYVDEVSKI